MKQQTAAAQTVVQQIVARLATIQQRINAAAQRAGRDPAEITLVAVSKTHPLETIIEAYRAGLRHFGENRAEECSAKAEGFAGWLDRDPDQGLVNWHFIGHLQSRQVGPVLAARPSLIHSVDSLKLARRIDRLADRDDHPPVKILLQCNVAGEESKSGFDLNNWSTDKQQFQRFVEVVDQIMGLKKINIQGLMTMAPISARPEETRPVFKRLAALRTKLQAEVPQLAWQHLSMGMTDDFEVAIEEGATIVRIGRAIFGERSY